MFAEISVASFPKSSLNHPSMEDIGGSLATKQLAHEYRRANLVLAPKDYFLGPVFAATPQAGAREVTGADRLYVIGGFHPMDNDIHPPALDVRHARAIFSLLSFRDPYEETRLSPEFMSFNT